MPTLTVTLDEVNELYVDFHTRVVICRFNGSCPKSEALHQWIFSNRRTNYDIHICSKDFFIVKFDTVKDKDYVLNEGPWFWVNERLFMIPWFLGFDATTMVVSKMLAWVRIHNLPFHFWHQKVLEGIWNSLDKFLKVDAYRVSKGIFTFARICVEVGLSKGLLDRILLIHNNLQWS